jgi:hypothetical protein
MKIKKDSSGETFCQILPNQIIIYDPATDSYIIETEMDTPVGIQLHTSKIPSYVLDQLYNESNGLLDARLAVEDLKK